MTESANQSRKNARARTAASDPAVLARLRQIVGDEHVIVDADRMEPYSQDAVKEKFPPEGVVFPRTADHVAAIL
jgi:hypothetical protein